MRIVRLYRSLPPIAGGMEKHIQRLTQEQRSLGCEVTVVFNTGAPTSESDLRVLPAWNLQAIKSQLLRDCFFYVAAILKIVGSRIRADAVHIHGDWSAFFLGRILRSATGARVLIASVHGAVRTGRWALIYKYALRGYSVVYCTGARDALALRSAGIANAQHQNSGIEKEFFSAGLAKETAPSNDVVCVANFFPVKNLTLVLEIARLMPEHSFLLIGEGRDRQALEAQIEKDGISNVRLTGELPAVEIARAMRTSRVFLITSLSEGTPTAMLEAIACGLPVVTSSSNDYSHLLQLGFNGYVIDDFDPEKYAEVLRALLSDEGLRRTISTYNAAAAQRHSWPEVAKRITAWSRDS